VDRKAVNIKGGSESCEYQGWIGKLWISRVDRKAVVLAFLLHIGLLTVLCLMLEM